MTTETTTGCPAWCNETDPGHDIHIGRARFVGDTAIVLGQIADCAPQIYVATCPVLLDHAERFAQLMERMLGGGWIAVEVRRLALEAATDLPGPDSAGSTRGPRQESTLNVRVGETHVFTRPLARLAEDQPAAVMA